MAFLSKEAILVQAALRYAGVESPLCEKILENNERKKAVAIHMESIISAIGLNLADSSIKQSSQRVANMYVDEIFSGLDYANFPKITLIENKMHVGEVISVRNMTLISTCEHHFMSINGYATVAYIPQFFLIGLSKINRIVRFFSQRPQLQERLTQQISVALRTLLSTENVAVAVDATHFCVKARGISDTNSVTNTLSLSGLFKSNEKIKQQFLNLISFIDRRM